MDVTDRNKQEEREHLLRLVKKEKKSRKENGRLLWTTRKWPLLDHVVS